MGDLASFYHSTAATIVAGMVVVNSVVAVPRQRC